MDKILLYDDFLNKDELNKLLNVEINWKDKKELINDYIPNTISLCNNIQKMKEMNKNIKIIIS